MSGSAMIITFSFLFFLFFSFLTSRFEPSWPKLNDVISFWFCIRFDFYSFNCYLSCIESYFYLFFVPFHHLIFSYFIFMSNFILIFSIEFVFQFHHSIFNFIFYVKFDHNSFDCYLFCFRSFFYWLFFNFIPYFSVKWKFAYMFFPSLPFME